jgi:predicted RNA-binding protein with PUA-like domain
MKRWLVKTEPDTYAWADLVRERVGTWDGVRSPAGRLHLRGMAVGDLVLVYHTGDERRAVGLARVVQAAFPDPSDATGKWVALRLEALRPLVQPVTLAAIKADSSGAFAQFRLVKEARLSVMPVSDGEWRKLLAMANTPDPAA